MASFNDENGRTWHLRINVPVMRRVQETTGEDLGKLLGGTWDGIIELVTNPIRFASVLFGLCKVEAEDRGLSRDGFEELIFGDTLQEAQLAFLDAVTYFFPKRQGEILRARLKEAIQSVTETLAKAESIPISSKSALNSPPSRESTPAITH